MLVLITVMCVIAEKKLQLNSASLRCRNFYHWLCFDWGEGRAPWAPPLATPMGPNPTRKARPDLQLWFYGAKFILGKAKNCCLFLQYEHAGP